jgi:hypothetical protein
MDQNFSLQEVKKKLGIKFADFSVMGIDPDDFMEGKISVRDFKSTYIKVVKKQIKDGLTTKEKILDSL